MRKHAGTVGFCLVGAAAGIAMGVMGAVDPTGTVGGDYRHLPGWLAAFVGFAVAAGLLRVLVKIIRTGQVPED